MIKVKQTTSPAGIQGIMDNEGYYARPYNDGEAPSSPMFYKPGGRGHATVGFGYLLHYGSVTQADIKKYGKGISRAQAKAWLISDVDKKYASHVRDTGVKLNQNQFDALVSFVYNCGVGYLSVDHPSGMGRALRRRDFKTVTAVMLRIVHDSQGNWLQGLYNRRRAEIKLFNTPYGPKNFLTPAEYKLVKDFDHLKKSKRASDKQRLEVVISKIRYKKQLLRDAARKDGWGKRYRAQRYNSLSARVHAS